MIKVEKVNNENSPDIKISDGTNSFMIARNNLPDLCWYPDINYFTSNDDITFTIKEEDGNIYILFDKLYQDIIDGNVFPLIESDIKNKSPEQIKKLKRENAENKVKFKKEANESGLVSNGVINWHSEDYDSYDFSSVLTIKKIENQIKIIFSKNKTNDDESSMNSVPTYNVRITESGGQYWPFYMIFINFRRQLQSLNFEEPISTEKVIYKKLKRT